MTAYTQAKAILDDGESRLKTYSYNRYHQGLKEGKAEGIEKEKAEGEKSAKMEIYESLIASGTPKDQALKIVKLKPSDLTP